MNKYIQSTVEYFRSAKSEAEKVKWPSREETIRYSGLIIGISLAFALFFALFDYGMTTLTDAAIAKRAAWRAQTVQSQTQTPTTPTTTSTSSTPASVPQLKLEDVQTAPVKVENKK